VCVYGVDAHGRAVPDSRVADRLTGLTINILLWNTLAGVCEAAAADIQAKNGDVTASAWAWPALTVVAAWLRRHPQLCQSRRPPARPARRGAPPGPLASAPGDVFWIALARLLNLAALPTVIAWAAERTNGHAGASPAPAFGGDALSDDEPEVTGQDDEPADESSDSMAATSTEEAEEDNAEEDDDRSSLDWSARSAATDSEFEAEDNDGHDGGSDGGDDDEDSDGSGAESDGGAADGDDDDLRAPESRARQDDAPANTRAGVRLAELRSWTAHALRVATTAAELAWLAAFDKAARPTRQASGTAWPRTLLADVTAGSNARLATLSRAPAFGGGDTSGTDGALPWRIAMVAKLALWLGDLHRRTASPPPAAFDPAVQKFVAYPSVTAAGHPRMVGTALPYATPGLQLLASGDSGLGRSQASPDDGSAVPTAESAEERRARQGVAMRRLAEARLKVGACC